jgi:hypothetical protein
LCFFSAEANSVFSTDFSAILFPCYIENTMFHRCKWPYETSLPCVKDQMKCEADLSGHLPRVEVPSLQKRFSFPHHNNLSHSFPIHIQLFCY